MKKIALTSLLAMFAVSGANAAIENEYATVRGGFDHNVIDFTDDDTSLNADGFMVGVAGGATVYSAGMVGVRAEAEYNFISGSAENSDLSSHILLLNGYADVDTGTKLTPYVGAGVGYQFANLDGDSEGDSWDFDDNGFAWQVGAGVSYAIDSNFAVDLGYRYVNLGEFSSSEISFDSVAHQFYAGAKYTF